MKFLLLLLLSSMFSLFLLIAIIFNIGRDGRDGTVGAKVRFFIVNLLISEKLKLTRNVKIIN